MSFSSETKNELAHVNPEKNCCKLAEIAGFIRMSGSVKLAGGGRMKLVLSCDSPAIARHYKTLVREYFDISASTEIEEGSAIEKGNKYVLVLADGENREAESILRETGILMLRGGSNYISDGIYDGLIRTKCCRRAYLRGAFLGTGTMSDPRKAYSLEIVCGTQALAQDLKKLFNSFVDVAAKTSTRGKKYVVYVKDGTQVGDVLNIMKAKQQFFALQDIQMKKQLRNATNRMMNCDTANLDKAVENAQKQLASIQKIAQKKGLHWLPEKLQVTAILRLENPEASLEELALMLQPPMSKSGINGRFRKIAELADKL